MTSKPDQADFLRPDQSLLTNLSLNRDRLEAYDCEFARAGSASSARSAPAEGVARHGPAVRPHRGAGRERAGVHLALASRARSIGTSPTTASARPGAARWSPRWRPMSTCSTPTAGSSRAASPPPATSRSCRRRASSLPVAPRSVPWAGSAATISRPTSGSMPAAAARYEATASISRAPSTRMTSRSAAAPWSKAASSCARASGTISASRPSWTPAPSTAPCSRAFRNGYCSAPDRACATSRRSARSASTGLSLEPAPGCRFALPDLSQYRTVLLTGPPP